MLVENSFLGNIIVSALVGPEMQHIQDHDCEPAPETEPEARMSQPQYLLLLSKKNKNHQIWFGPKMAYSRKWQL